MKKYLSFILPLALFVSGCSQEESLNKQTESLDGRTFTASFEEGKSRTYLEEEKYLRWTADDRISIFDGNTYNQQYKFDGETGANAGSFTPISKYATGNALPKNYAVYPYAEGTSIKESGVMTVTLPAEQTYAENSFGLGANTMVAVTEDTDDTFLKFKNVGGYLKLQLYGKDVTVKSITLQGNSNEKIAGKATLTPVYGGEPTTTMTDEATQTITLDCGEGIALNESAENAKAFWLVVPPTTFAEGFTITVTDVNGGEFTKTTSKSIAIERNNVQPMKAFEVELIPNNEIWYTSSDGNVVTPYSTSHFGANIVSNTYVNGKGIIKFDNDVTNTSYSFTGSTTLTSITLPNSVTYLGEYAFSGCTSLTSVIIPNSVVCIGYYAFFECSSLVNVTISNKVTEIRNRAFQKCTSLAEIILPSNSIIGDYVFANCSSLKNIFIPSNVTKIGEGAFVACSSLESIIVEQGNSIYDSRDNCNALINSETNNLLLGCKNTIIPTSVKSIGADAFSYCISLVNILIPNSVERIGYQAFYGCTSLSRVDVKALTPPTIDMYGVFTNCSNDIEIFVPSESIGLYNSAFYWKDLNLLTETVPDNQIWYTSSDGSSIVTPYSTTGFGANIISNVYKNGKGIITFDDDITMIGSSAFYNASLKSITIPNSVTEIKYDAFYNSSLESFTMPNSVISIGTGAFRNCRSLTYITISDNVTEIPQKMLYNCTSLENIILPSNVTYINVEVFDNCSSLIRVDVKATTPPAMQDNVFAYCSNELKIYVPKESLEAYQNHFYWKKSNLLPDIE